MKTADFEDCQLAGHLAEACDNCGSTDTTVLDHVDEKTGYEQSISICSGCGSDQ